MPYARQRPDETLQGTVLPVGARENPLGLAHEQGQPGHLAGDGRHDLGCRTSRADHPDTFSLIGHRVIPVTGVEHRPLEGFRASDTWHVRVSQHPAGVDHEARGIPLSGRGLHAPQELALVEGEPGHRLVCTRVLSQAEPVDDVVRVGEQLALRGERFPERKGYERDAVEAGWNVHLGSGIGIDLPGAAQLRTPFQQDEVVAARPLQADRRQEPREAGPDDQGLDVSGRRHQDHRPSRGRNSRRSRLDACTGQIQSRESASGPTQSAQARLTARPNRIFPRCSRLLVVQYSTIPAGNVYRRTKNSAPMP